MPRCPTCSRRLASGTLCPADGSQAPESEPSPESSPPTVAGYRVEEELGTGGFATVWRAFREGDDQEVAIKVAHTGTEMAHGRFEREGKALETVGRPHVPEYFGHGALEDGRPYLIMERLYGDTLAKLLEVQREALDIETAAQIGDAVLAALQAAHEAGAIHRDLKPENVFISPDPPYEVRLMDFGLTKNVERLDSTITRTGAAVGTPEYMSPEQISAEPSVSKPADIYAAGLLLYELFTLRLPFTGTLATIQHGHLVMRPPNPCRFAPIPDPVGSVILTCLAKDPGRRYSSVKELRASLKSALSPERRSETSQSSSSTIPIAKAKPNKQSRLRLPVVLLFFPSSQERLSAVQELIRAHGGYLAHADRNRCVAAYTHESGENPARVALACARTLRHHKLTDKALVDLQRVIVRTRPDQSLLFVSPLFRKDECYPTDADPEGVMLSQEVSNVIPDVAGEALATRKGVLVSDESAPDESAARMQSEAAVEMVGRDDELTELVLSAEKALTENQPTLTLLLGEPGIGKSLLTSVTLEKLLAHLPNEARVIQLRANDNVAGNASQLQRQLAEQILAAGKKASASRCRNKLEQLLGDRFSEEHWVAVALALGHMRSDDEQVKKVGAAPGALHNAAVFALGESMRKLAESAPVVIVIDDAQWIDASTLDAIEYAALSEHELPIWALMSARPNFSELAPQFGHRAAHFVKVDLEPLAHAAAVKLCRRALRPVEFVPEIAVRNIVTRTHGNPLLMLELIRGFKRDGYIRRTEGSGAWYLATDKLEELPEMPLVQWLANREMSRLPADLAGHAQIASLVAPDFTFQEIEGILDWLDRAGHGDDFPLDAMSGLEQLVARHLIQMRGDGRFRYRHGPMRDAVAGTIPKATAEAIHRAALSYYRESKQLDEWDRLPRLAQHAAAIGESEEAAKAYDRIIDRAIQSHAYVEAEATLTKQLQQLSESQTTARLAGYRRRGLMRCRIGRYADSLADFEAAIDLAEQLDDKPLVAELMLQRATSLDWTGEWQLSRTLTEQVAELMKEAGVDDPVLRAGLLMAEGRSAWRFSRDRDAATLLKEAAALAENTGDEAYETFAISLLLLGYLLPGLGRLDEAEELFEKVIEILREKGDDFHLGAALNNRVMLWTCRNNKKRLMDDLKELLALARRTGIALFERGGHFNLGAYLYWLGDFEPALRHAERARRLDSWMGVGRDDSALLVARIRVALGDLANARTLAAELRARLEEAKQAGDSESPLAPSEEVLLDAVELATREDEVPDWNTLVTRAKEYSVGQEYIEILEMKGKAAMRHGDIDAARDSWQQAISACQEIPNVMRERLIKACDGLEQQGQLQGSS